MNTEHRYLARIVGFFVVTFLYTSFVYGAVRGVVKDSSGAIVPKAKVYLLVVPEPSQIFVTNDSGEFNFESTNKGSCTIFASAVGLTGKKLNIWCDQNKYLTLILYPSAVSETVVVEGRVESPLDTVTSSISVLTKEDLDNLQTPRLLDAIRFLPGVQVNQTGHQGGVTGVFVRGADSRYNLVTVDGVKVNDFGGPYNFSNLASESVDRLELMSGPQSAIYGSYAIGDVFKIKTASGLDRQEVFLSAERGNFGAHKLTAGGGNRIGNFGFYSSLAHTVSDGMVANDDSRFSNFHLKTDYSVKKNHHLQYGLVFNSNKSGNPGPFGSDPANLFQGLDLISRTNESYDIHSFKYDGKLGSRTREQFIASVYSDRLDFESGYGPSFTRQNRQSVSSETSLVLDQRNLFVFGIEWSREKFRNSFVTNQSFEVVPLNRNVYGLFIENHFKQADKLFLNTGARLEYLRLDGILADPFGSRPDLPESVVARIHPKISMAYLPRSSTRFHASIGTGLRPPDGFELAFTTNPALKPERAVGYDVGFDQQFFGQRVTLGTTWFYNRFYDQIVTLSQAQSGLSRWRSDNLANSVARGIEESIKLQVGRNLNIRGAYTYLDSSVLSLDGSSEVQRFFFPGQQLLRRPRHSGSYLVVWQNKRLVAETGAVMRGKTLDTEPNYGVSAGQFANPFYITLNAGAQYQLGNGVWITTKASNLLDRSYEESLGFPALGRNFTVGMKWRLSLK